MIKIVVKCTFHLVIVSECRSRGRGKWCVWRRRALSPRDAPECRTRHLHALHARSLDTIVITQQIYPGMRIEFVTD